MADSIPRHPSRRVRLAQAPSSSGSLAVADGMMALHYYDRDLNGQFRLALVPLGWDADGWPELHW